MKYIILLLWLLFTFFGFNSIYTESNESFLSISFLLANITILYPVLRDIMLCNNLKNISLSIFQIFSIVSYLVFILPLRDIDNLYFYNTVNLMPSLTKALFFISFYYYLLWAIIFKYLKTKGISVDFQFKEFSLNKIPFKIEVILTFISIYLLLSFYNPDYIFLAKLGLGQVMMFIYYISSFWIAYLFLYKTNYYKLIAIIWYIFFILYAFASTQAGYLIIPSVSFLILYYFKNKRIPYIYLISIAVIFTVLAGFKNQVRTIAWGQSYTISQSLNLWQKVLSSDNSSNTTTDIAIDNLNKRIGHIALLTYTIDATPDRVQPWGFYSYQLLFSKFIPRIFWPNKPKETLGNYFGKYYGILNINDNITSINLPIVVEAYVSFSWFGILLAILPALVLIMAQYYIISGKNMIWRFFGMYMFFVIINFESNFSLIAGDLFLVGIFLLVLDKFWFGKYFISKNR